MTVFDEILAYPIWRQGEAAFTANVNINLRKPVPMGALALFEARVTKVEGRKRFTWAKITDSKGTIFAEATGIWVTSAGIGRSMAVHEAVIAADKERMDRGERALVAPFAPNIAVNAATLDDGSLPIGHRQQVLQNGVTKGSVLEFQHQEDSGLAHQYFDVPQSSQPKHPKLYRSKLHSKL
jgi:hypothetical protein